MAIKDNQKQYYDAFIKTNSKYNKGDITTFVYEFLDIVKKGFENTLDYLTIKCVELNNITNIVNKSNLSKMEKDVWFYGYYIKMKYYQLIDCALKILQKI